MRISLENWQPKHYPDRKILKGQYATLELIDWDKDGLSVFEALGGVHEKDLWRWTLFGPFSSSQEFVEVMKARLRGLGTVPYLIRVNETGCIEGMCCFLRIRPEHGSAEIGAVAFSDTLKRTIAATETVYLMGHYIMSDLGYRRFEWKCNSQNKASRKAGERFGFTYEGTFRNDYVVVKPDRIENRDTDWLTITDQEWPSIQSAFEKWLSRDNFDKIGQQRVSLSTIRYQG